MTISNGQLADSEEIISLTGQLFANICPLYWNASYTPTTHGFGNNILNNAQIGSIFPSVAITNNTFASFAGTYISGILYDLYNSSVDTSKWECASGSLVEDTEKITCTVVAPKNAGPAGVSIVRAKGLNVKPGTDSIVNIMVNWKGGYSTNSGTSRGTQTLQLWDGSTAVNLASDGDVDSGSGVANKNTEILLTDVGGSVTCLVGTDTTTLTPVSIGTLSGSTWTLRVYSECYNTSSGSDGTVYAGFGYYFYANGVDSLGSTAELISTLTTTTPTITDALLVLMNNFSTCGATVTTYISADGTNYTSGTVGSIIDLTNSGTTPKIKITASGTPSTLIKLKEFGILYNVRQ